MKCKSYYYFFKVFANKTRFNIIESLLEKPKCVSDICEQLNQEQSKISHNLKKLVDCHFVTVRKDGKQRIYALNQDTLFPIMNLVEKHVSLHCGKQCWVKK